MGLVKTKDDLKALTPDTWETIWPGDDAVDLDQSDLAQWCTTGGMDGLVLKGDVKPTVFKLRPLPSRAYKRMIKIYVEHFDSVVEEALRMGLVSVSNAESLPIMHTTEGGMRVLTESTIDLLGSITMELPADLLSAQWIGPSQGEDLFGDASKDLVKISLAQALGAQVLAATFRERPLNA